MSPTRKTSSLVLEGSSNWSVWKFQVRIILNGGIYGEKSTVRLCCLQKNNEKLDKKLCTVSDCIQLAENVIQHVINCNTSAEIWAKLLSLYEQKSSNSLHLVQQKFFAYKYAGETFRNCKLWSGN